MLMFHYIELFLSAFNGCILFQKSPYHMVCPVTCFLNWKPGTAELKSMCLVIFPPHFILVLMMFHMKS